MLAKLNSSPYLHLSAQTLFQRHPPSEAMRLLFRSDHGEYRLTKDLVDDDPIPPYAILSHTWNEGQEVTFKELIDGTGHDKTGYEKIRFCGEQARHHGLQYFWVDTC